jgi:aspartyl-tRNA(Asn)/glutamyl-tRNA(Gln) amidotransferase subunit A
MRPLASLAAAVPVMIPDCSAETPLKTSNPDMHELSIAEIAAALRSGQFSSVELTGHMLERIEALNPSLNSFITVTAEAALAAAAAADVRLAADTAGPLTGVPIAHKDIFCTEGVRTTCGSRMLERFVSPYDATVVANLQAAGAVMLGKTNMDEFAMGSSNETSFFGPVRNPWRTDAVPGGSSGGSAAAVAARLCAAATGTDTGGSIRQPAALTGITGLKPTYGRCSRWGMVAFASSLDQAGPMTRSAEDAALMLAGMAGFDPRDSTSAERPVDDYMAALGRPIRGLRIGIVREFMGDGLDPAVGTAVHAALDELQRLGAELIDVSLPHTDLSVAAYYVVAPAECSSNLARFDGVRYGHRCDDPRDLEDLYKRSRSRGLRRRGQATDHDRDLCPVGRLLRRLLPEGAEDPPAHRRRFPVPRSPTATSSPARPRRGRPSRWGTSRTIRWPCTCRTSTRSRSTSPGFRRSRSRRP